MMAEKASTNIVPLEYAVNRVLTAQQGGSLALDTGLEPADKRLFFELVWELISTGVLVPYGDSSNTEWPQVSLTTEGLAYAETGEPSPADPDGFLRHVEAAFPGLPSTVSLYLREAIAAFNRRLYLATSVMLGVAAEGLLLKLADAVRDSHAQTAAGAAWHASNIDAQPALRQYRGISGKLQAVAGDMPHDLREVFDSHFRSIRGLIREQRNEAGHPTGNEPDRQGVLPSLYLFAPYAGLTAGLVAWLEEASRF